MLLDDVYQFVEVMQLLVNVLLCSLFNCVLESVPVVFIDDNWFLDK